MIQFKLEKYNRSITERLSIWIEGLYWIAREFVKEMFTFPSAVGVNIIPRPEPGLDEVCSKSFQSIPQNGYQLWRVEEYDRVIDFCRSIGFAPSDSASRSLGEELIEFLRLNQWSEDSRGPEIYG